MARVKKEKTSSDAARAKKRADLEGKKLFLLILPFLILSFLFSYFPLHGWIYAFFDYKAPLKLSQCDFVGLKWFKTLFSNSTQVKQLIQVMNNTFAMSLLGIATSFLPVLFAVFLNEIKCKWFKNLVQTLTTLPNFISWTLVYAVAFSLFSTTGMANFSIVNYLVFALITIICAYPFYYLIINSISANDLSNNGLINIIP